MSKWKQEEVFTGNFWTIYIPRESDWILNVPQLNLFLTQAGHKPHVNMRYNGNAALSFPALLPGFYGHIIKKITTFGYRENTVYVFDHWCETCGGEAALYKQLNIH